MTVLALIASACGSGADEQQEPAPAFGGVLPLTADYGWAHSIGGADADEGRAIAVDSDGNVYITGKFKGEADFNPVGGDTLEAAGGFDAFLAKYDKNGVYQWAHNFGGSDDDEGFGIAVAEGSDGVDYSRVPTSTSTPNPARLSQPPPSAPVSITRVRCW